MRTTREEHGVRTVTTVWTYPRIPGGVVKRRSVTTGKAGFERISVLGGYTAR